MASFRDAQASLGFVVSQTAYIERQVNETLYPDIQYAELIPVDTTAPEWIKTVTYYSMDKVGVARWINGNADDVPMADVERSSAETGVYTAGIGYGYGLEEINQAQMLSIPLASEKAMAARRAYEEMVDRVALYGDTEKGFQGLLDNSNVTATAATTGDWPTATDAEILGDLNQGLSLITSGSNYILFGNVLLISMERWQLISTRRLGDTETTLLEWFRRYNVYTASTGQPLTIRGIRGLSTAGVSGNQRLVAYWRNPQVLKLHIPMPHRFLPVYQAGPLRVQIPGIFRLGGVDIRRPDAVKYVDGI